MVNTICLIALKPTTASKVSSGGRRNTDIDIEGNTVLYFSKQRKVTMKQEKYEVGRIKGHHCNRYPEKGKGGPCNRFRLLVIEVFLLIEKAIGISERPR